MKDDYVAPSHSGWKYVSAIFVDGKPHSIWRDVIGKQRAGERSSCEGYLKVIEAVMARQWADKSTIANYGWDPEKQLWIPTAHIGVRSFEGVHWESAPDTLQADVEILDPGGPPCFLRRVSP